jgi:hypothetical protein
MIVLSEDKDEEKQTFTIKMDKQLVSDFKIKCIQNNKSMSAVVIDFMKKYIKD